MRAKFPEPPGLAALRTLPPVTRTLPVGTRLTRIFFASGRVPGAWNRFRHYGPTASRFDHHLPDANGSACLQARGVLYAAHGVEAIPTCLAEVFQQKRLIDVRLGQPVLAGFELIEPLELLDLSGAFATTIGASTAIHSGARPRARRWARALYEAYPSIQGMHYCSSMYGNAPALVLFERAATALPDRPRVHRLLADPALDNVLCLTAEHIRYQIV